MLESRVPIYFANTLRLGSGTITLRRPRILFTLQILSFLLSEWEIRTAGLKCSRLPIPYSRFGVGV
jgi:hypothetical protein